MSDLRAGLSRDAVIVAAARTPIGKRGGALAGMRPDDLLARFLVRLLERANVDPAEVEDLIVGCGTPSGEQGWNIARQAALIAGFPHTVPGVTVNRMCGSSDQALRYATQTVRLGDAEILVAAGVESMSRVPMTSDGTSFSPALTDRVQLIAQGYSAELIAQRWGISREEMDAYAVESHRRAVAARDALAAEIVAVELPDGVFELDEGPRTDTSLDRLALLRPAFRRDGLVTAGNSSQMSDGAAGLVVMSEAAAARHDLPARARVVASVTVGSDPVLQLTGVLDATRAALARAGLDVGDIDHFEVNEAFSAVPLLWLRHFDVDPAKLNPCGGGLSLGHPLGATGARMATTMLHALERSGGRYGLQTMCIGHGMANATVIERLG